jgi:hypothetical protein
VHWYGKDPALGNVRENVPDDWSDEFVPDANVTLCMLLVEVHVQVTCPPSAMVLDAGVNVLSPTETFA